MQTIYMENTDKVVLDFSINDTDNRLYFSGYFKRLEELGDLAGQGYLSFVENIEGSWTAERLLAVENNGYFGSSSEDSIYAFPSIDVAYVDLGDGVTEAVAHTFNDLDSEPPSVYLIDTGTCSTGFPSDCISSGESLIKMMIGDAQYANFGEGSVYFSSTSSEEIFRYSLASGVLKAVGLGNESNSPR